MTGSAHLQLFGGREHIDKNKCFRHYKNQSLFLWREQKTPAWNAFG
jgi:hypothetical protein